MKKNLLAILLLIGMPRGHANDARDFTHPILLQYIQYALQNNLVLKQKNISIEQSLYALKEARSYFLPGVGFGASYQTAGGGRNISIPVGDLLNPVYTTLNQLTGSSKFPTIENVNEQFFPRNFYDVRFRTSYAIVNPARRYNQQIKEQEVVLAQYEMDIYKRELTRDVKTAYYTYLLATEAISIYESAKVVVHRNLEVNRSLFKNGKGLPAYVSRSEAELEQVEADIKNSMNEAAKAKAYFNFLLNRAGQDSVYLVSISFPDQLRSLADEDNLALTHREELKQLETVEGIQEDLLKLNQSFRIPRVNAFLDLGAQAMDMKINNDAPYYLLGMQLDIPIFQGKKNLYAIERSKLDLQQTRLQKSVAAQQINLAAFNARNNLLTSLANNRAAEKQLQAARSYFKLIDRGRSEGVNSFIEWLDARNQLTQAEVQVQLTKFKALISHAEYERQIATQPIAQ